MRFLDSLRNFWTQWNNRPLRWGPVPLVGGRRGVNHLPTHLFGPYDNELPLSAFGSLLALAREAGVQIARGPFVAPWALRSSGYPLKLQVMCRMMVEHGIEPVPWLSGDTTTSRGWLDFCVKVAELLPAAHYGIMNEPNRWKRWPPAEYANWLSRASQVIRAVKPNAKIVAPSLGHDKYWSATEYMKALDPKSYDVAAVHLYDGGTRRLNEFLRLVSDNKPVWVTEDGKRGGLVDAAMRGSFYRHLAHPRVKALFWYCWWNPDEEDGVPWNMIDAKRKLPVGRLVFRRRSAFETFKGIR